MQPWDRQPFDTDETFKWFVAYRDAKPPRSLSRIKVPGTVTPMLQTKLQWYNDGHWRDRAVAWDEHCDALRQEERQETLRIGARAAAEKEALLADTALDLALNEVDKIHSTSIEGPMELDPRRVAATMATAERAVKVSRLVRGEATEKVDTGPDYSALSVEELRQLKALRDKARSSQG